MALSTEEKDRRKEERRQKKYNENHKMINNTEYKLCNNCREWHPCTDEYFYKVKNNLDGLRPDCIECTKQKSKQWQEENPEKYKESFKRKNKKYSKEFYSEYKRKWREEKSEHIKEYEKEWQENNKDKIRKYNKYREIHKNHRISKEEWENCKNHFNYKCAYCGLPIEDHINLFRGEMKWTDFHKEHVIHNGSNDLSNCVPSCKSCNSKKHDFEFEKWYTTYEHFTEERFNTIICWINLDYKKYINYKKII